MPGRLGLLSPEAAYLRWCAVHTSRPGVERGRDMALSVVLKSPAEHRFSRPSGLAVMEDDRWQDG